MAMETKDSLVVEDGDFETDAEAIKIVAYKDQSDVTVTVKTVGSPGRAIVLSYAFMITVFNVLKEVKTWHPDW